MKIGIALLFCILSASGFAQQSVPAERERHHKVVFENSAVRILEGRVSPHDTTPEHTHSANAVVVFLSPSTFGIQRAGQKPVLTTVRPGDLRYVNYGDKPVSHIVWEEGSSSLHFLVVELKKERAETDTCPVPATEGLRLVWRRPAVTAWSWYAPGRRLRIAGQRCAWLSIDITRDGRFTFFAPGAVLSAGGNDRYIFLRL